MKWVICVPCPVLGLVDFPPQPASNHSNLNLKSAHHHAVPNKHFTVNGADGQPIKVPCQCPPDQTTYINALTADVLAGHAVNNPTVAVSFPTDDSTQSQITRINAALVALQNLEGPGKGCPAASTTLLAQQKALQAKL